MIFDLDNIYTDSAFTRHYSITTASILDAKFGKTILHPLFNKTVNPPPAGTACESPGKRRLLTYIVNVVFWDVDAHIFPDPSSIPLHWSLQLGISVQRNWGGSGRCRPYVPRGRAWAPPLWVLLGKILHIWCSGNAQTWVEYVSTHILKNNGYNTGK